MSIAPIRRRARHRTTAVPVVGGLLVLGLLALATPAVAHPSATAGSDGPVTVPAPGAGDGATVTVSRTIGLVNQTVRVSWSGFRPSSATRLQNSGDSLDVNTENPVRVYECRGADPASSSDCYGSPGFRGVDATATNPAIPAVPPFTYPGQTDAFDATPDGPANWQDTVTGADGTGQVTIQLFTKRESAALGCDAGAPCSLVVVPNYGRPQGDTEDLLDAPWAWARRTVVPLGFLPVDDACPLSGSSLRVEGSPMVADLLATWRGRTCTLADHPVTLDYTSIGEPQTRGDVASGTTDTGLVIDPLDADAAATAGVVYAPVTVTGLVVAFQIDDAHGRPVTSMHLNARLVAKLITASYRSGGDPAVIDNPVNIFHDPEFLKLNPGVDWPGGAPGNHPLLLGDLSDTTLALTRWIASDPDARAFLKGKPDPWGMTVNATYKDLDLPFAGYPLLDQALSSTFQPIQGMDALARQLSIAQFPGALVTQENGQNVVTKQPRQNPGAREVFGIIDAADAAKFLLPTASLQNASGAFVAPTTASLQAGITHAVVNADGVTRRVDLASQDPHVYPLTLLVSAALSTHADKAARGLMADFLDYVDGPGQVPGQRVGQLPPGHAPLTKALRAEVTRARAAVLAGPSTEPTVDPSPTDTPPSSPTDQPTTPVGPVGPVGPASGPGDATGSLPLTAPSDGASPSAGATPPASTEAAAAPQMVAVSSESTTARQLLLPVLLGFALLGLVAGPALLWLGRSGRGPQWLQR
ncbi:substrate-binding domain-containing protein [Nocardioides cynanchi]|uniref:substrate-binding domain-containing protein n=1 Tax=Nocardioides cynanchi TaxID=2558918 RepID=UPI00177FA407|nr:substrate-binding domain-containing protein [Nocardioides cynanchi]